MSTAPAAVTMLVSRRVRPGQESRYIALMEQMMATAAGFAGHLGGQLMPPGSQAGDEAGVYHVIFAFDSPEHLQAWQDSPARALGLAAIEPLTIGPAQSRQLIGLADWFTHTSATQLPPPRWKVAMMSWLGIFPTVLLLNVSIGRWLAEWPLLPRTLAFTGLVVLIMTWLVGPQLGRWLRPWLHAAAR